MTTLNDRIDDIQTAANKDIARGNDANRFGNPEFRDGLSGNASLIPTLIDLHPCAHWRNLMEEMRDGCLPRLFRARQQCWTISS